jgi:anhydro-N-acetylmuramic acid kinase
VQESRHPEIFLGMISGTSRDGVDAVLVDLAGEARLIAARCLPYPADLADALRCAIEKGSRPADDHMASLDRELGAFFAKAALTVIDEAGLTPSELTAIGSHGQTVWHDPDAAEPETIQLGSPALIAGLTGVTTVGQFRQADLSLGGQGAPLAPLLHRALLRPRRGLRAVVNLGGIANVSLLDAHGGVTGFDTGPANCLLDAWISRHRGLAFDEDGRWSASGRVAPDLLSALLADPYFYRPPPKSTGLEYFNASWLERQLSGRNCLPEDVQATLAELSAATVALALKSHGSGARPGDILVCGGGVHNTDLMKRLRRYLPKIEISTTADHGIEPDWVEGILFAWLARERLAERPQETPGITGAREAVLLGEVFTAP